MKNFFHVVLELCRSKGCRRLRCSAITHSTNYNHKHHRGASTNDNVGDCDNNIGDDSNSKHYCHDHICGDYDKPIVSGCNGHLWSFHYVRFKGLADILLLSMGIVEPARLIVALAVKMGHARAVRLRRPPPRPPPPSPSPPPPSPPSGFNYNATHGEDSRLIAYVGNWQACPTPSQYDAYTHMVIAFAVSYTWAPTKNNCDQQCAIQLCPFVTILIIKLWLIRGGLLERKYSQLWRRGMGGSWSGDQNNCWDYCFGKEEQLATNLVSIINNQKFDGIDIDYEYCYDINGSQAGRCPQRSASYTDLKAQTFLRLTSKLRVKLDALQVTNGYNHGRYELTHAPMDSDLTPSTSKYFQILKARRADLDFLLPQFYNGVTKAHVDGFGGSGAGAMSAASLFSSLRMICLTWSPTRLFSASASCHGFKRNAAQAVKVMSDLKIYNNGQFSCNGGAFFWVAEHDTSGTWSDAVVAEVSKTAGCSSVRPTQHRRSRHRQNVEFSVQSRHRRDMPRSAPELLWFTIYLNSSWTAIV
ncbi:hypothetical protein ACHAW5_005616 [Stephanodiscus triporus]|uniref:GH18 domain-containing protein n=1 Tax=Stephanodiscus triporus TaxID=2934178 RepID=A0ABD3NWL9_9STRA